MTLIDVKPIGTERGGAFVDYTDGHGAFEIREFDVFPLETRATGAAFRRMRVDELGLSLRQGATRLALSVVDLCSLECGRKTFASEADRAEAEALLRGSR